jgi:NodT family efflux transporter outer membrane factor (OMF) lipoprotein
VGINAKIAPLLAALLTGCAIGPDFHLPHIATPSEWFKSDAVPQQAHPPSAVTQSTLDVQWWHRLHDAQLDKLVSRIAAENLDMQTEAARLEESRAQLGIAGSALFPQVNGDASYTREKLSDKGVISLVGGPGGGPPSSGIPSSAKTPPFNVYQYGLDASWEIDLWGRVRRGIEAADATLEASQDARRGTELSVIAELVSDYVRLRGTQAGLQTARDSLNVARQIASLARERARGGLATQLDVAAAEAQTATISAQLPQLTQQEANLMNAIALLLGQWPGALDAELSTRKPIPPVPPQVPVGVPSELAQRRPDIRAAQDRLHAATAEIGIAEADFFPRITLMGNGDLQALQFGDLNSWAAHTYSFGPSISLPIFEGGRLVSTLHLRNAQQREAAISYRKTLLTAFHEVDNALTAFRAEQQRRRALSDAVAQNKKALRLATERYRKGLGNFIDVLNAERSLLSARQQRIESTQTESLNMVQLYKALGGGWQTDFPAR